MSTHHDRATTAHEPRDRKGTETLELANSTIRLEHGPAGTLARIDRDTDKGREREYVGPLPQPTVDALREVGRCE